MFACFALFMGGTCVWLPIEAHAVISNATTAVHCVAQSYAGLVVNRCTSQLQSAIDRNAALFESEVVYLAPIIWDCL